jgi:LuxR family maltose regulon positive regulatory protein
VAQWLRGVDCHSAWVSLDEGDNAPTGFLAYLIAALRATEPGLESTRKIGKGLLSAMQSPQPPPAKAVLASLINELSARSERIILVLDDYHLIDALAIHEAVRFFLEHLPPQVHLVIASRDDPPLGLARLRARGQLVELRVADLRFTSAEAATFLNQVMDLNLSAEDVAALEARTEGWIAGLHFAALALQGLARQGPARQDRAGHATNPTQGHRDASSLIRSFTGSHRFVLDYLIEEVLEQQPPSVQAFLLRTSILDRLCGPLCDAVCFGQAETPSTPKGDAVLSSVSEPPGTPAMGTDPGSGISLDPVPSASGQEILEYLEHANLFIIPLDDERRWYRYHHLFGSFLRQRLRRQLRQPLVESPAVSAEETALEPEDLLGALHTRASQWHEENGLVLDAFRHAAAADDVERAERLIAGERLPQHFLGAVTAVLEWLASLPKDGLDARPWLWWRYASLLLVSGHTTGVEERLQAAEAAIARDAVESSADETRDLIGLIAAARATLALTRYDAESMRAHSQRALEHLHPDSLLSRSSAYWTLGYAHLFQGDRAAAFQALSESIAISQAAGDSFTTILAKIALGNVQEAEIELHNAAETYRQVLGLAGDQPLQIIGEAHLGLARVLYEWNDLDAAEEQAQQAHALARQYESVIDRFVSCEVLLARLKLACGDVAGATRMLAEADETVRRHGFLARVPEVAAAQIQALVRLGRLEAALDLAGKHNLPADQARVHLARKDPSAALAVLGPYLQMVEARRWADEELKATVLAAIGHHMLGNTDEAVLRLAQALDMAEPVGFVRTFVDEGPPMAGLLRRAIASQAAGAYARRLLAAFPDAEPERIALPQAGDPDHEWLEPLTERELEVLQLISAGLTNQEIADRLYLSLHTVKVHARNIFSKLAVKNRTQAVARGRALGILKGS